MGVSASSKTLAESLRTPLLRRCADCTATAVFARWPAQRKGVAVGTQGPCWSNCFFNAVLHRTRAQVRNLNCRPATATCQHCLDTLADTNKAAGKSEACPRRCQVAAAAATSMMPHRIHLRGNPTSALQHLHLHLLPQALQAWCGVLELQSPQPRGGG
jgi:hypothetical protein